MPNLPAIVAHGDDLVIPVQDEGISVMPEDLSRVFDRSERGETGFAGTGLRFSVVQEITMLHRGRFCAESKPSSGLTFHLVISGSTSQEPARQRDGKSA